jgi:lysophospholipase L1-like esterase
VDGPTRPVAAFIGDSYTEGYAASSEDTRWTAIVSRRLGWVECNLGRGSTGYLTSSPKGPNYLGMIDQVVNVRPDIVVVAGGQNDKNKFGDGGALVAQATSMCATRHWQSAPTMCP